MYCQDIVQWFFVVQCFSRPLTSRRGGLTANCKPKAENKAATIRTKWNCLSRVALEVSAPLWRHWQLPFRLTWLHKIRCHCWFFVLFQIIELLATGIQAKLALALWKRRRPGLQCRPVITQRNEKLGIISSSAHAHTCRVCAKNYILST